MARQRLSWDAEKMAEIEKKADPYTMNQDHANNPVEKYKNWDTETGGEAQDKRTPWKGEGRLETGHPSPERQAVMAARKLEDKAIKCITIAQRMLPGAADSIVEEQATDLMYMPEKSILSTLQRQASLAEVLAGKKDDEEEVKPEEKKPEVEAAKVPEDKKPEVEEVKEAKKDDKAPVAPEAEKKEEVAKEAAKAPEVKPEEKKPEVEAAKVPEEKPEEKKPEVEETKEAGDMLDVIFDNVEKTGAKKLSGLVKQASTGDNTLNGLWDSPPDVSKAFK
jgi:hypothetical protein